MALFQRKPEKYFQFYAQVHFGTCADCLDHHGEISEDPRSGPPLHPHCRCQLLEFPKELLEHYQEQGERMKLRAQQELARRQIWRAAVESFNGAESSRAEELFRQAAQVEFYLEEVEHFCQAQRDVLDAHAELRARLQKLFIKLYRMKFSLDKYQAMSSRLILHWETRGIERIKELLP